MGVGPERVAKTNMNRQKEITEDSEEERDMTRAVLGNTELVFPELVQWAGREVMRARSTEKAATKEETTGLGNRLDGNCEKKEESK